MAVLVYPTDRPAYSRLCRLLTLGKARGGKARCILGWDDLAAHGDGLVAVLVPDEPDEVCAAQLARLRAGFGDRAYLALTLRRRPNDALRLHQLAALATVADVPTVATNDVLYHHPARRILQDVVTCVRHNCSIDELGFRRERFADHHLRSPAEMVRLFPLHLDAVARTIEIVERCTFSLDELAYQYPHEEQLPGESVQQSLERLVLEGADDRYPAGVPENVEKLLRHELRLIGQLGYAPYFLTVNAIVQFARGQGILCQGRGSAANSAVCFVLGHHLDRPHPARPAVRALRQPGAQGAAGHRCRFRARAARDRHAVGVRHLWPRPCGPVLDGDPLPRPRCDARRRQGAGPAAGPGRHAGQPGLGLERAGCGAEARPGAEPRTPRTTG